MTAPNDSSLASPSPSPSSSFAPAEIESRVVRVAARKEDWLAASAAERIAYLRRCIDGVLSVSERWVRTVCDLKGISPGDPLEGEEWLAGPMPTVRNARLLIEALEQGGRPRPSALTTRKGDGRIVARVFPANLKDRILFSGFRAEVVMREGMQPTQRQMRAMSGRTALVLGGGNVSSIAPMDVFYKLFVEDQVVILKMNPVNATLGPILEEALRPLIDDGYLTVVYGGADVGARLAEHPSIDTLHVTGSHRTYDAIVWEDKAAGKRKNERPFSAELGCVTPILVVPGPWSAGDMRYHARQVAGMVVQNASFNCNAAKVLVLAKGWLQRARFLEMVAEELGKAAARRAYYPGAKERYEAFLSRYPQARVLGKAREDGVPWTLIPDVSDDYALQNEAFCGVLAEVSLEADDAPTFLEKAVSFANERCWGTLSAGMLVHPTTHDEYEDTVERAIADLRYGSVAINVWPAVSYALGVTTWGAFPGHDAENIGSGTGVVHNTFMFDHPEKSVVRAPFRVRPTPPWFPDHRNLTGLGRELTQFEASPTWGKLLRVVMAAVRA